MRRRARSRSRYEVDTLLDVAEAVESFLDAWVRVAESTEPVRADRIREIRIALPTAQLRVAAGALEDPDLRQRVEHVISAGLQVLRGTEAIGWPTIHLYAAYAGSIISTCSHRERQLVGA